MTVQCPNCSTKYRFDDSRLKEDQKVRCTRCKHVFTLSFLNDEDQAYQQPPDPGDSLRESADTAPEKPSRDDMHVEITPEEKTGKAGRPRLKKIGAVLALFLIVAASLYVALPKIAQHVYIPFVSSERDAEEVPRKEVFTEEDVRDISLENVRQYFVNNEETGQLFVVEGRAVNEFDSPRARIKLRAALYDNQEQVVQEKEFLAGNAASLFQLQVSSRDELESTLTSQLGILTNNKHIEPGESTPFMTVFFNPPEEVQEFGLEVIEAHIPE
ncbi:MJ0042 family finger-like protein [Desulfonatronospira thiodismutans ASO3-1]|uniref:MJ0042 family finger-like protein n=1 Tax=Desulfonatronospira thiodismutans ASO3-1 TaxID=555779 RepID=D6SQV3_9BACT|nr:MULTISPECIES: DUF3426 domain-containing protein [Desulfonatronospira]EFI35129.1 MJ0042 family finger-like protein [Desulfonatronospira thiodismutans ASO3-1]RQD75617.1 MAG: DUF3426 domain-containing protein [Desulfonatronospira sp. MSAO_Bac3]